MAQKRDYYEILGIGKQASPEELKSAYRKAAIQHHPDKNQGDKKAEERFKEATEAYQVLSDPQKREAYNRYGHEGVRGAGGPGFGAAGFEDIFGDIFEDFFGGSRRRRGPQRGGDLQVEVEISFEQAAFGVEKEVGLRREESCSACKGSGAKDGTAQTTCATCRGTGQIVASSGFFSVARPCPRCHGRGTFIEEPCDPCGGDGRVTADRKVKLKIPAGVDNGIRLRMTGEGEAGTQGGPRGDLYVDLFVRAHEIFTRRGTTLVCEAPISFVQAALGAEIDVPTLEGTTALKIPVGTQPGKIFKLKGKGLASLDGRGLGDMEVHVVVETPTHLSDKQKDLLKQFAALSGEKVNPLSASFVNKMKELFKK